MTGAISIVTEKALKVFSAQQKAPVEFSGAFVFHRAAVPGACAPHIKNS
jgi:hypothetical protein